MNFFVIYKMESKKKNFMNVVKNTLSYRLNWDQIINLFSYKKINGQIL